MAGYLILPAAACDWTGEDRTRVTPNPLRYGLFDLLREFEQEPFPFTRQTEGVCLLRLDELLVRMGILEPVNENRDWPFLTDIKKRLKARANDVSNMGTIHVPIIHQLDVGGGSHLFARYAGKRIPLWRLFGSNPAIRTVGSHIAYEFGENLS